MNPLSYAEVVRGVANIPSGSKVPRRVVSEIVELQVVDTHVNHESCLDEVLYTYRSGKIGIKFVNLSGLQRFAFYSKATDFIGKWVDVRRHADAQHLSLMPSPNSASSSTTCTISNASSRACIIVCK